mgnify:FL=1
MKTKYYTNGALSLADHLLNDLFQAGYSSACKKFKYCKKEQSYLLEIDVPGFLKKDIKVSIEDSRFIISGKDSKKKRLDVSYSATVPNDLNIDSIKCNLANGVLQIKGDSKKESKTIKIL